MNEELKEEFVYVEQCKQRVSHGVSFSSGYFNTDYFKYMAVKFSSIRFL